MILYESGELSRALGLSAATPAVSGVSIDSRTLESGDAFFAVRGERFDGAQFLPQAFERGARCAIVSRASAAPSSHFTVVRVEDVLASLTSLAAYARRRTRARIVAITGSVGKTSTRAALTRVLSGKICSSRGNLNNHIGLPLSLARMAGDCDYGVFELAMNRRGEIGTLAAVARPHAALITAITEAHLEFFKDVGEICDAKAEIFSACPCPLLALLPSDGVHSKRLYRSAHQLRVPRIATFGGGKGSDYRLRSFSVEGDKTYVRATFPDRKSSLHWRIGGRGRVRALVGLAALGMADMLGESVEQAASALDSLDPLQGRGLWQEIRLRDPERLVTLIDESYNSSPSALRTALEALSAQGEGARRIAVLGDMLELGERGAKIHHDFASTAAEHCDVVFTSGRFMQALHKALPSRQRGAHTECSEDLIAPLLAELKDGDTLLVKGSKASGMGFVVRALEHRGH